MLVASLWGKAVELFPARLHMVKPLRAALFKHSQSFWWKIKPSQMLSPIPKEQLLLDVGWRSAPSLTSAGCVFWVSSGGTLQPEVFPQAQPSGCEREFLRLRLNRWYVYVTQAGEVVSVMMSGERAASHKHLYLWQNAFLLCSRRFAWVVFFLLCSELVSLASVAGWLVLCCNHPHEPLAPISVCGSRSLQLSIKILWGPQPSLE